MLGGLALIVILIIVLWFFRRRGGRPQSRYKERPVDLINADEGDEGEHPSGIVRRNELPEYYQPEPFMVPDPTLDGVSTLREAFVNVDCWSKSYLSSHRLANAVESVLLAAAAARVLGSMSPPQEIDHARVERRLDLYESDTQLYRVSLQFLIAYYPQP